MSKLLFAVGNVALYSGALSSTVYYRDNNSWGLEQCAYLGVFWLGFMLPSGIIWGQMNRIAVKALQLPLKYMPGTNNLSLNYFSNKRALFTDILMNQGVYSVITIYGLYSFFNEIKPELYNVQKEQQFEKQQDNQQENLEQNNSSQDKDSIQDIVKGTWVELLQSRVRLTLFSTLWDIWYPQFVLKKQKSDSLQLGKKFLRVHKFKEIMFLMMWQHCIISAYNNYQQKKIENKSQEKQEQEQK